MTVLYKKKETKKASILFDCLRLNYMKRNINGFLNFKEYTVYVKSWLKLPARLAENFETITRTYYLQTVLAHAMSYSNMTRS